MNDNVFVLRRRDWEGIPRAAVNPSMEASSKTSMFCTPREIPSQSQLLVIGLVLQTPNMTFSSGRLTFMDAVRGSAATK